MKQLFQTIISSSCVFLAISIVSGSPAFASPANSKAEVSVEWSETPVLEFDRQQRFDLLFPEPASTKVIYRALAKLAAVDVLFDPKLKDHAIELVLHQTSFLPALEALNRAAGHFFVALDSKTVLVADDTPQMRREYEPQVLRSFAPEHAHVNDLMTVLRSLLGVKHIAVDSKLDRLVMRDSAARVELAQLLIEAHDRAPAEFEFDVELLRLSPLGEDSNPSDSGRLSAAELAAFKSRSSAVALTRFSLQTQGQRPARYELEEVFAASGSTLSALELRLELELSGRVESESSTTNVEVEVQLSSREMREDSHVSRRRLSSSFRLTPSSAFVITGLSGSESAPRANRQQSRLALVITPRIVSTTPLTQLDQKAYWSGTESRVGTPTTR